jgi:hypothetical protein
VCSIYVETAYRTPPSDICATLVDSASAVEGVLSDPKPLVIVTAFNESGIQYRFPIGDYARRPDIESTVRDSFSSARDSGEHFRIGTRRPVPRASGAIWPRWIFWQR